jgi:hypothetical protein
MPTVKPTYGLSDDEVGVDAPLLDTGVGALLLPNPSLSIVAWLTVPSAVMPTAFW